MIQPLFHYYCFFAAYFILNNRFMFNDPAIIFRYYCFFPAYFILDNRFMFNDPAIIFRYLLPLFVSSQLIFILNHQRRSRGISISIFSRYKPD